MTGRAALVTGAGRGIGRAVAERLADRGAVVAVHYRHDDASAAEVVATIAARGGRAFPVRADLAGPDGVDTLFAGLEAGLREHVGEVALDVLVNNAGIGCPGEVEQLTPERFDRAFAVNVRAPVFIVQRALPLMRRGGRIVNISSLATRVAHPRIIGYAMTKGALDVFGRTLAEHLGPRGITVNTVSPGLVDTDFHGDRFRGDPRAAADAVADTALGRMGQPGDVADVVDFLTSERARWITGERLETAGGTHL
ncbi:SDR family NAD(P)-dependent oxidoreductase [Saccharothrix syringae]|uniref:SDR family oxidoreductase n=1 Tax=Saccharothrix syringae TaxID=103733 RepID=A0A5Q0H0G5_SACSY|nr:SDR family oxidoreductase [Saccharothrix syringae]QFZ19603.1 SDR family oxidoreductase [Saccharothrix syringae]